MTIDEAIESLKSDYEIDMYIRDIAPQLSEWLELLKWYQQGMEDIPTESGVLPKDVYRAGYIKAIDDFVQEIRRAYDSMKSIPSVEISTANTIALGIAEKLKDGGKNENTNDKLS